MKTHYSIAELLDLQLSDLPATRKGLDKYVSRNCWKYIEVSSRGKGGTRREYELPANFTNLIYAKALFSSQKTDCLQVVENEQANEMHAGELMNWQREVAENRLFIVQFIAQQVATGMKKTSAIENFVADAEHNRLNNLLQDAVLKANAKAGDSRTVSRRSVFDWIKAVDEAKKSKLPVISVLAPKARRSDIPAWAVPLLKLWGQPQKPTLTVVLEQLPNFYSGKCPSYNQAYRFIKDKIGNVEAQRGRMGPKEMKNLKPFIRRDTSEVLPSDIYTADGHCFDAEVAHPLHGKPFRPEITSILDVGTRRVVGWSVDLAESGWAVLDAIRLSCTTCGIPAIFYVDNGSGYKNDLMAAQGRGLMARLGTQLSHALPYNSQAKGLIERSHQTLWVKAAKNLPTYIGKDMDAEASNKMFKLTRNEIKTIGTSQGLMSWNDFLSYIESVVDDYNNKPHSGLRRITDPQTLKKRYQTPLEAWNEAVMAGAVIDVVSNWDAEDLFRPYVERKVRRGEIELFGNRYFSTDLTEFHGDAVLVGYDIHNADQITVKTLDGQFICHAMWNANKRAYFPQSKIEQARQQRATGRLRRLAAKAEEVHLEANPHMVLEHIEQKTELSFSINHQRSLQELQAIEVQSTEKELIMFKKPILSVAEDVAQLPQDLSSPLQRWMALDQQILGGESVSEEDQTFWTTYQMSKKFKQLAEDDAELSGYLAQREA